MVAVIYSSGDKWFIINCVSTITKSENRTAPPIAITNWKLFDEEMNAPKKPPSVKINNAQNSLQTKH